MLENELTFRRKRIKGEVNLLIILRVCLGL
jgi:hypothetical protein